MIRKLQASDRDAYLELANAFYHSEAVLHAVPQVHLEKTFEAAVSGSPYVECLLFEENGQITGFALLALTWSQEAGGLVVWIEELFVKPEYRGQGIGKAFFAWLEENYPNASRFRLEIEPDNHRAEALYRQMGFDFLDYRQMVAEKGCK